MALRFTDHPDVVFQKAPLVMVLSQIRYEPVLSLMSEVGIAGFQEGVRHLYPHIRGEQAGQLEIGGQLDGSKRIGFQQSAPIWRLTDEDAKWRVSLAVDFVALEAPQYRDFGEFLERLMFILDVLDRTVNVGDSTRIGVRKINLLTHPSIDSPTSWLQLLRPELLATAGAPLPGKVVQSLSETRLQEGLAQLTIRHGLIPKAGAELLASSVDEIRRRDASAISVPPIAEVSAHTVAETQDATDFVLDLDYGTIAPYPARGGQDMAEVLKEFSDGITSFFHWAITPEYFEWLSPEPRRLEQSAVT
ncbi:MAG TPA: TIGR04255 family protein [Acidimicrobiales bacterium]|nr:TIGR04255 family protein [Acidimicrobiales bacterium]